jgi:hypothetical protein
MGSSGLARYERAGNCLSTAEPADVHQIATPDAVKFQGEGRVATANASDRAAAPTIPSFDIALLHKSLNQERRRET